MDLTYDICDVTIIEEIVQCLGIMTACWGQLKPFLTWLKSNGGLQVPGVEGTTSYKMQDTKSHVQSSSRTRNIENSLHENIRASRENELLIVSVHRDWERDWEVDSQSSQAHIIQEDQHQWIGEGSEVTIKDNQGK